MAALTWRFEEPLLVASTAPVGGGLGPRAWVLNAQVPADYGRRDVEAHVGEVADALGLQGPGVGMLTAAEVADLASSREDGVWVDATVGLTWPVWAAAPAEQCTRPEAGTVNVVAFAPARHTDAALTNLLCTMTEAKVQALFDGGVAGTGTASDAVTVLCPAHGETELFGGPRSRYGADLARAVHAALRAGMAP